MFFDTKLAKKIILWKLLAIKNICFCEKNAALDGCICKGKIIPLPALFV